jgi:cleavage and polyadenylation specificity factor subunit 4
MIGPNCRHRHIRSTACQNYLTGFCPEGPDCSFGHPKYDIPNERHEQPPPKVETEKTENRQEIICFDCGEKGHYYNNVNLSGLFNSSVHQGNKIGSI